MRDLQKFIDGLHDYIGKAIQPVMSLIEQVRTTVSEQMAGVSDELIELRAKTEHLEAREPEKGEKGEPGEAGRDGRDAPGEDEVRAMVVEAVAAIPAPKDGVDGKDGTDGKSFTIDDVRDMLEAAQAKWALEFEIRAQATLQRAIDAMPKPVDGRDGVDGKDGRDGLDLKHFSAVQDPDGRTVLLTLKDDERTEHVHLTFPVVLDKGFWKPGTPAEAGDGMTFGGSYWIAQKDTDTQPATDNPDWRLAVKKGRDARMVQTSPDKGPPKPV